MALSVILIRFHISWFDVWPLITIIFRPHKLGGKSWSVMRFFLQILPKLHFISTSWSDLLAIVAAELLQLWWFKSGCRSWVRTRAGAWIFFVSQPENSMIMSVFYHNRSFSKYWWNYDNKRTWIQTFYAQGDSSEFSYELCSHCFCLWSHVFLIKKSSASWFESQKQWIRTYLRSKCVKTVLCKQNTKNISVDCLVNFLVWKKVLLLSRLVCNLLEKVFKKICGINEPNDIT